MMPIKANTAETCEGMTTVETVLQQRARAQANSRLITPDFKKGTKAAQRLRTVGEVGLFATNNR